jgi:excisionase family DNA binding protein
MLTLKETHKLTGIKPETLRQRIRRGKLQATKRGRDWYISDKELERLKKEE